MSVSVGPNMGLMINALTGDSFDTSFRALLRAIDAGLFPVVIDHTLATPPATPANGDRYIVAASPTGAWTGKATDFAVWSTDNPAAPSGEWEFYAPENGWTIYSRAAAAQLTWNGTAWVAALTPPVVITNTVAATVPLTIKLAASQTADALDILNSSGVELIGFNSAILDSVATQFSPATAGPGLQLKNAAGTGTFSLYFPTFSGLTTSGKTAVISLGPSSGAGLIMSNDFDSLGLSAESTYFQLVNNAGVYQTTSACLFEGTGGLGLVLSAINTNAVANPPVISIRPSRLETARFPSGGGLVLFQAAPTVAAGQVAFGATTATTATAGAQTLPANPAGFLIVNIAGTQMKIPYYAN